MGFDEYFEHCKDFALQGYSPSGMSLLIQQFRLMSISNVYHYTDINGFISIMQTQELWASHIAFMNDKSEYLHGKELFRQQLMERMTSVSEQERQYMQRVIAGLDREASDGFLSASSKDVFSISFSYNRDSLEMWRGYGKQSGIAIGFDHNQCNSLPGMCLIREEMYEKLLEKYGGKADDVCPDHNHFFHPMSAIYKDDLKLQLIDKAIELGSMCFRNQSKIAEPIADISATQFLSDLIFWLNPFLKHQGFEGEAECRFVDNFFKRTDNDAYRVYYRERGGIVLPYVKYKLMDLNCRPLQQLPIHEIIVGPGLKQSKVVDSIKYFLEKNNMSYLIDRVQVSDIPYIET